MIKSLKNLLHTILYMPSVVWLIVLASQRSFSTIVQTSTFRSCFTCLFTVNFFYSNTYTNISRWTLTRLNQRKGIVHPKMKMWCLSAYPQGIQDVGDFVSSVEHKRRFLTQTVAVCQSYNGSQWDSRLWESKKHTQTKPN